MFQLWTAAVWMEVVDSTIKSALKTWQTSSTGRTRESPLWSHDPWTHRSREAAGRPEKNELFEGFRRFSLSQKRVEALGKEVYRTFKARPRLGLQEPTSRELTVFVTRTLAILSGFLLIGDSLAAIFWKVNFSWGSHLCRLHHPRGTIAALGLRYQQFLDTSVIANLQTQSF